MGDHRNRVGVVIVNTGMYPSPCDRRGGRI